MQILNEIVELVKAYGQEIVNLIWSASGLLLGLILLTSSILIRNRIKNMLIALDDILFEVGKSHGRIIRKLVGAMRLLLPSNPLRAYVDYRVATSLKNDGICDLSEVPENQASFDPERDWRLGFSLFGVMAGFAVERQTSEGEYVSEDLIKRLEDEDGIIVVGRPGSGKSTICKQVGCKWFQEQKGPVLYRESGHGPIKDEVALQEYISKTPSDKTLLVVVEDITNPENVDLTETLVENDKKNVRYLFDSKVNGLENLLESRSFNTVRSRRTAATLISEFCQYSVPIIDEKECQNIIDRYVSLTGNDINESAKSLYQRTQTETDVGQMLMLVYELTSDHSGMDDNTLTGLELDVRSKYGEVSNPGTPNTNLNLDRYDSGLLFKTCFSINLFNVVGIPLSEGTILSIAEGENERNEIQRILESLDGWLIFIDKSSNEIKTYPEFWSVSYLSQALSKRETISHDIFISAINSFLGYFPSGSEKKESISTDNDQLELVDLIHFLLTNVYNTGSRWPILSKLFVNSDISELNIPKKLQPELNADLLYEQSIVYQRTGQYGKAMEKLEEYYEIAVNLEYVDQSDLEIFYGHTYAYILIEAEQFSEARNVLEKRLNNPEIDQLSRGHLLNLFGIVSANAGEFQSSINVLEEALEIAQEYDDLSLEFNCTMNRGTSCERGGQLESAKENYTRAAELAEETGNLLYIARAYHNLGQTIFTIACQENDDDRLADAQEKLRRSYRIKGDIGDIIGQAKSLGSLSSIYHELGDLKKAKQYVEESMSIGEKYNHQGLLSKSYHNYALLLLEEKQFDEAENYFLRSREVHKNTGNVIEEYRNLNSLALLSVQKFDLHDAVEYAEDALEICIRAGDPVTTFEIIQFLFPILKTTTDLSLQMRIINLIFIADFEMRDNSDTISPEKSERE